MKTWYKMTDKDMRCKGFQYKIGKVYSIDGDLVMCENGFHACKDLADCFQYYDIDKKNRIFKVILSGDIIHGSDKDCGEKIEFIEELQWDSKIVLDATSFVDEYKYRYCCGVKDRKDIWSTICGDEYKYWYCRYVKDREELWATISGDKYKYRYCRDVGDREELWPTISDGVYKYLYCLHVKHRRELWSTISVDDYKYLYCCDVEDCESLH